MKRIFFIATLLLSIVHGNAQTPTIQWQKSFGGTGNENANSIVQTTDGGYILAGYTSSSNGDVTLNKGGDDYWIVKLNASGTLEWQKTYGGSSDDQAYSVVQTTDGGYIVAGYSYSVDGDITNWQGDKDYWILKLDAMGDIQWQKKYGGDDKETAYSIKQTLDGGYIVAGNSYSYDGVIRPINGDITDFHGGVDGWIVKLSSMGTIEWQKCMGGTSVDGFYSIEQTADGGYIATGEYYVYGYWLVKLDSSGNMQWQKVYSDTDTAFSVNQTSDGGYIMAGDVVTRIGNATGHNFGIMKVNSIGTIEWNKSYGGDGFFDIAKSIKQTSDGGYIVTGVANSYYSGNIGYSHGGQDVWLLKISSLGVLQWQTCLGGNLDDGASVIQKTADNGYVIAGFSKSSNGNATANHGGSDVWVIKMSAAPLGVEESPKMANSVYFSPNPAKDKIVFSKEVNSVAVISLNGTLIQTTKVNGTELNISNLKSGAYILKIITDDNAVNHLKLVKE